MTIFETNGQVGCILYRDSDWERGLNFITPPEMFLQVGSWWYDSVQELQKQTHNDFPRTAMRTQESVFIKRGRMRVDLYTEGLELYDRFIMNQGDLAVFGYGGHGYFILDDDTQVIETKNGPFIDVETDKTKF